MRERSNSKRSPDYICLFFVQMDPIIMINEQSLQVEAQRCAAEMGRQRSGFLSAPEFIFHWMKQG
jgi:hypothetical protein